MKINWYKFLHRLHLYAGLVCAVYLLMIGVSTLNFQHQFLPEQATDTLSYSQNIEFDSTLKIDTLANFIRLELGIKGYLPPWEYKENKQGLVRFKIERPARTYQVKLKRNATLVNIDEIHYSAGKILRALHFGGVSSQLGDPLLNIWAWYGQVSGLCAFFAIIIGIWIWFKYAVRNRRQWFIIVFSGLVSFIYILYIWLIG